MVMLASVGPWLKRMAATFPSTRGPAHTSVVELGERIRRPWTPRASWFTAIASVLRRIVLVSSFMFETSHPMIRGAFIKHHKLKWLRYSVVVIPLLPTSNMSGSFHPPGPAWSAARLFRYRLESIESQLSLMSFVVLHELPTARPQVGTSCRPHSQREKNKGCPVAFKASRMGG